MYERLMQERSVRRKYAKNKLSVFHDTGIAVIEMANGLNVRFDAKFADIVGRWAWCDNGAGYACNGSGTRRNRVYLHRFVLWLNGTDIGEQQVDHINRDTTDNRLSNLRVVSRSGNQCNRRTVNGLSGFRGVSWDRSKGVWMAYIKRNQRMKFLGYFNDKTEAAKAYDRAAIAHGGVYRLNFEE